MTVVAVTGGRDLNDEGLVFDALSSIHASRGPITLLVHGACPTGADKIAADWAEDANVPETGTKYEADWRKHGKSAGPIRNKAMLEIEKPSILIAFPGGRGTADCVRAAKSLGIEVLEFWR